MVTNEPIELCAASFGHFSQGNAKLHHGVIREAVADEQSLFAAVNKTCTPQRLKMLRRVRKGYARFVRERFDRPLTLSQQLEEFDAERARQRLPQLGEVAVQAVFEVPVCGVSFNQVIKRLLDYLGPMSSAFGGLGQTLRRNAVNSHANVRLISAADRPSSRAAVDREDGACRNARNDRPIRPNS